MMMMMMTGAKKRAAVLSKELSQLALTTQLFAFVTLQLYFT
jgi:hypothetical protein